MQDYEYFRVAEYIANACFDGHFTLMKFTTNWRCCFGTPNLREDIDRMAEGKTAQEAVLKALTTAPWRSGMTITPWRNDPKMQQEWP